MDDFWTSVKKKVQNVFEKQEQQQQSTQNSQFQMTQQLLGLNQNTLNNLQKELIEQSEISQDFIDYLCKKYKLTNKKKELIQFCNQIKSEPLVIQWPVLLQIKTYQTKQKIIDFIVKNQKPTGFQLTKDFENMTLEQFNKFKESSNKFNAITFYENQLFKEERDLIFQLQQQKKSYVEIQNNTLIHMDIIQQLCEIKIQNLKKQSNLLALIGKFTSGCDDVDKQIDLIVRDEQDLVEVLLQIYKDNRDDYFQITKILRDNRYALNFEQSQLEQLNKLAREDLSHNKQQQQEVQKLLDYFLCKDIILYLMVLNDFNEIAQTTKNFDMIILDQKHSKLIPAIVQLLILEDPTKKKQVIQDRCFKTDPRLYPLTQELEEKIKISSTNKIQKQQPSIDENLFQQDQQFIKSESSYNDELIDLVQTISNITNKKIIVYSKSELTKNIIYKPEVEQDQSTLHLVRDDLQNIFQVMIRFENQKNIIDWDALQSLKIKYSFLSAQIPQWLEIFIKLPSFYMYLMEQKQEIKKMLEDFSLTFQNYIENKDEASKQALYSATMKFNLDSPLMQDWINLQNQDYRMGEFYKFMISKSTRQKPQWAIIQVNKIQQYFPMNAKKLTLNDFNRVQTYQDPDDRKDSIEKLKQQTEKLTSFIINTLFGVILRKEDISDMSQIQTKIEEIMTGSFISLRFLVSYLLQSADMGLRARLNYYLCQNKSVPLIMNCQQTFKNKNFLIYNQELVFSISQDEGVGVFAYGVGKLATNPCGKSEISNLIVTPKIDNKSFDVQDMNVFSNGQIDVFFEKCYQKKSGWAFMDGQGKIQEQSLLSVLPLTNIIFIHFFQRDKDEQESVKELSDQIEIIKKDHHTILVCLILRDCTETDNLEWLPNKDKVDKMIELANLQNETRGLSYKLNLIEKMIFYFNEKVREIKAKKQSKFTKQNFLNEFCKRDHQGQETQKRILEIIELSQQFIYKVQVLKENVFNEEGLPSLKIKDEIREIVLKLRSFEFVNDEDQKTSLEREKSLKDHLDCLTGGLNQMKVNSAMEKFWEIVNHKDAVQIKIEVSKCLTKFTQENISDLNEQKKVFMNQNGKGGQKKNDGLNSKEDIQKQNDEYKDKMKQFENEIFKRSLSYEYFWRSLISLMLDSKECKYWSDINNRENFKKAVKQQMLDGDTFELIDGRNLEMKADIIREILGIDTEGSKCIVACVIGPQSSGKSTLMNFCFGTQFLASTGRCTQGIYFTLQKIPEEMKEGKSSDIEYLIILDTEGLNSPERAEGDRTDSEYDRKIVLFTLLSSDFLIINSSGDMSLQMKELIKICAVRYDELRMHSKAPKILYTFVKNGDDDPDKFMNQISSLKSDVIESSDSKTIGQTADELMTVHQDLVKVLGSAYDQKLIEKNSSKGIHEKNHINLCAPLFGVQASEVWKQVQKFLNSGQHQFRQIGKWLQEAQEHWSLIDRQGANITQFANVLQMKNDRKIKSKINEFWQQYLQTQITFKDNQKAQEKCNELYQKFIDGDGEHIMSLKNQFIKENNEQKDIDFFNYIEDKFQKWKLESSQKTLTVRAELKHMDDCKLKMSILKQDYGLLIDKKFKESQLMQIHNRGISDLGHKARNLYQNIKKLPEPDQDKEISREFEKRWEQLEADLSNETKIEQLQKSNSEDLCRTFKSVNKLMPDIEPLQFSQILDAAKSQEMYPNSNLPKKLVQFLVEQISQNSFKDKNQGQLDTKSQFGFDQSMLGMLQDPKQRIFGNSAEAVKEKYLHLQNILKVDYTYSYIQDFVEALNKSSIYNLIESFLNKKKVEQYIENYTDLYKYTYRQKKTREIPDKQEIIDSIKFLFQELGDAGFYHEIGLWNKKEKMSDINVEKYLQKFFDKTLSQNDLVNNLRKNIKWSKDYYKQLTLRIANLLSSDYIKILINKILTLNLNNIERKLKKSPKLFMQKRIPKLNINSLMMMKMEK